MRLCGFQEKNSSRYITRSALGNHTYITNTNGEGLIQKLRHRPHWLQHGIEKASEVNAAREERREAAGGEGLRSKGGQGHRGGALAARMGTSGTRVLPQGAYIHRLK